MTGPAGPATPPTVTPQTRTCFARLAGLRSLTDRLSATLCGVSRA